MSEPTDPTTTSVSGLLAARPEPDSRGVLVLAALFLFGCISYGYGDLHMPWGGIRYTQNLIMVPPVPGVVRETAIFDATADKTLQLIFAPTHPRPHDMPDTFTFDWKMTPVGIGAQSVMEGTVQFTGERFRARPNDPPLAVITLPGTLRGNHTIAVRPHEVGDWPDLEVFIVQASNKRFIGFAIAGIFWSVFLALTVVVWRRHRHNVRLWERLVRPASSPAPLSEGAGEE